MKHIQFDSATGSTDTTPHITLEVKGDRLILWQHWADEDDAEIWLPVNEKQKLIEAMQNL
jgi:hypothetical protein